MLHCQASFQVRIHFFIQTNKCVLWEIYGGPKVQNTTTWMKYMNKTENIKKNLDIWILICVLFSGWKTFR